MVELELIAPGANTGVAFSEDVVRNTLSSLILLSSKKPNRAAWILQTAAQLSPQQLQTNRRACQAAVVHLEDVVWASFPAWLDHLDAGDAHEMRDQELEGLYKRAERYMPGVDFPTPTHLLADRDGYLSFVERTIMCKGGKFDRPYYAENHRLLNDPPARKALIVTHLRTMWEKWMAQEWTHNLPLLRDSVTAFKSLNYDQMSNIEILLQATERDALPNGWRALLADIERTVLIPSPHINPHIFLIELSDTTAHIIIPARVPHQATLHAPELSRFEIASCLGALTDEIRLSILKLLAQEGELDTKTLMTRLNLSQSSASRHLGQLASTGYLSTRRDEGGKHYRLNRDRIDNTFGALKKLLN